MKKTFDFDYDNSLVSVSNSLLKYYRAKTYHPSLKLLDDHLNKNYKNVIFMILDGMGTDLIEKHLPESSFIRQHISAEIFSVFPPTTTAATTACHSGMTPLESGWLGWSCYYKQYDRIIETFPNTDCYSGEKLKTPPPATDILKYETIYEKITAVNPHIEFHKVFPNLEKDKRETFAQLCQRIQLLSEQNDKPKLFAAYWKEPDASLHKLGTNAPEIKAILLDLDANLKNLSDRLKDSLLIITADHGQIDVEEIALNDYPDFCKMLIRPPALESRFITFFVQKDCLTAFRDYFNRLFSEDFRLFTKDEFLNSGILGNGKMHGTVPDFLGDFVAIAYGTRALRYFSQQRTPILFKGNHSGMTAKEMCVPLLIIGKKD